MDKLRTGGGIQLYRLAKELSRREHNVTALFADNPEFNGDFEIFKDTGVILKFMKLNKIKLNPSSIKSLIEFRRFIQEENFDIIHCHKGKATTFAYFATLGLDVSLISNRGVTSPIGFWRSIKYKNEKIKKIIAVSKAVKDVLVNDAGIPEEKIEVVYGSVDTGEFKPGIKSTLRKEFNLVKDSKVIGFVGNAGERKGLPYLIESFKILLKTHSNIYLILVGIEREQLKQFALPPQVTSFVITTGFRKDVPNLMAGFDIFAFSGISDEGLTGTVREAASCGIPIVTTDVAGNGELIRNKVSGLVVPIKDPERMAEAFDFLFKNYGKAKEFGVKAREIVLKKMTDQNRTSRIEKIYYQARKDKPEVK